MIRKLVLVPLLLAAGFAGVKTDTQTFPRDSALLATSGAANTEPLEAGARREQKMQDAVDSIDGRVHRIEDMNVDRRLAVLESIADREWHLEIAMYGVIATLFGNLVLGLFGKKERSKS